MACGVLVPWPRIRLAPPAAEAQTRHHWTAREVPPVPLLHAQSGFECLPTFCDSTFQVHLNISPAPALESTISPRSLLVPFIGEEKIFAFLSRVLYPWLSHLRRSWSAVLPGILWPGVNGPPSHLTARGPLLSRHAPALERRLLKGQGPSVIGQCESPRKDRPPHCPSQPQSSSGFKERKQKEWTWVSKNLINLKLGTRVPPLIC